MIKIPLHRKDNKFFLEAEINDALTAEFVLDTGCPNAVISKEVADLLYLYGKLSDEDITGYEYTFWGNHCFTSEAKIKIKKLSFGKFAIHDIEANICNRYGIPSLFGMSCLDSLKDYAITDKSIKVDDGKWLHFEDLISKKVKKVGKHREDYHSKLKRLHKEKEAHPEANYKFDYRIWGSVIDDIIASCLNPLKDKDKYDMVIPILEDLRSLIKNNLEYDQDHPDEHGAFISGYFNFYLASAYFQAGRLEDSIDYYEKTKTFFMEGTPIKKEIDDQLAIIKDKIRKDINETAVVSEPKLVPMRAMDFDGDVKRLGLNTIEIIDEVYGNGTKKNVLTGFKDFKTAFDFSVTYHKRLEIIKYEDGVWHRTRNIPTNELTADNLNIPDDYMRCFFEYEIERRVNELKKSPNYSDIEFSERIERNKEKAIEEINKMPTKCRFDNCIILKKNDLSYDCTLLGGGSLQWRNSGIAICAIDVDKSMAKSLVNDVVTGKFIPCALGQMPEDFLFLNKMYPQFNLSYDNEGDYEGNNDPRNCKWIACEFVVMDRSNNIGYCCRGTYDNIHWRWENGRHSLQQNIMECGKDINKNEDYKFCYWQLVRSMPISANYISSKPF